MVAGMILAAVLLVSAAAGIRLPAIGMGAVGLLPLAAAMVDAVRLRRRFGAGKTSGDPENGSPTGIDPSELRDWLDDKADSLAEREQEINAQSLALQQWMQFPDAIDFRVALSVDGNPQAPGPVGATDDPMARHDRELFELIELKTRDLFEQIKQDSYRIDKGDGKVFDNDKIRADVIAMVSDVAAIYRPGETSLLLKTNVEAVSRAVGRASLRLLVAVEGLPGGLASYDFQSIYNLVIRAVRAFGIYKSAKPYIDVASSVLFAGRIVSSTNPLTLVAWWAASRATTYGASKLGTHVLDQQAVGLIRQLVEIVAIEVASIYSPMVRYRDIHWIYGVELVHLASALSLSDSARVEVMKQLAALNLRDEYGRVSLMRHVACGTTSRPANYHPSVSLSAADRQTVAERLEAFLLAHVLNDKPRRVDKASVERWQDDASERLEIQFRAGAVDATADEQRGRAVWALAAFCLQHLDDEPHTMLERLAATKVLKSIDKKTQSRLKIELQAEPPFMYHPPIINPDGQVCELFVDDLVELAACSGKPNLNHPDRSSIPTGAIELPPWSGEAAIRMTAYFLRRDVGATVDRFHQADVARLMGGKDASELSREAARAIDYLAQNEGDGQTVRCVFCDAIDAASGDTEHLVRVGSTLICFTVNAQRPDDVVALSVVSRCERSRASVEKVSGYVRSDCRVVFPDGTELKVPGSTLRGYDAYFAGLLEAS